MVKGNKKNIVTKEDILGKISTYDIYRHYLGDFKLDEPCVNKYRGEKDPSLIVGTKVSRALTHKDFGDYRWRGDAFHFVQQIYNCDYVTALRSIDRDMRLGIGSGYTKGGSVITWKAPIIDLKLPPLFQVIYYSKMSRDGLRYWSRLEQGEDDLRNAGIFQPKEIWRNKKKVPLGNLLTFVYRYEEIDKWKVYRPFAPKKTKDTPISQWKWDSNVPFDYVDNLPSITNECESVYVAKSRKDRLVLTKALETNCIVDVQAEDPACLSDNVLNRLLMIKDRIIISDNDKKGKDFSWWLTRGHGFRHINVPDIYRDSEPSCTDFADLCYHYGMEKVINYLKGKLCV